jgi:hypothetical protein
MTRTRWLVLMWLVLGAVIWNAAFDIWMTGAPREYLLQSAVWELGRGPEPSLAQIMAGGVRGGVIRATAWTVLIVGAGLLTIRMKK